MNKTRLMGAFKIYPILCLVALWGAGCGYQLEGNNPQLPAGATTIALAPIQNQTFQAGLESQLNQHLKQLLRNNASVRMSSLQNTDLLLEIHLQDFKTQQTAVSSTGSTTALQFELAGLVVLNDLREKESLWRENSLSAKSTVVYEQGESDKAGTMMSRGLNEVTDAFAKRIYERIFFRF